MNELKLDGQELQANLAFLDRCQLTGKEAETMVRLRYKLIEMLKQESKQAPPPKKAAPSRGPGPKARKKR